MSQQAVPGQRGLTLVEVVVALAVLSLILLALGASLRGLSSSAQRIDERVDALDEMRVAAAFMRESVDRLSPMRLAGPEPRLAFAGEPQSMTWVALFPVRFGAAGRHAFRLALEPTDSGAQSLVLRYVPWSDDAGAFPDWGQAEHRVIAHAVTDLRIAYGGQGLVEGWQEAWPPGPRLPARVRIELATAAGEWPALVLPLRQPPRAAGAFTIGGSTP